ncbi:MAG: cobalt ECF transporter T component CbiQ [Dehalococcoidia bacterium]|nr:cobalt ECF transporter T component CbiQ [Dehalococcoidia bacterium]
MTLAAVFVEHYRHAESVLHRADARVKLPTAVLYILAISLARPGAWLTLGFLAVPIAAGIGLSRLPVTGVLGRSMLALPFVLAAVPIAFTTPGTPLVVVPLVGWDVSDAGLVRLGSILVESWLSVLVGVLLTSTTPPSELLRGLRALRLPRLLVATVFFTYRYLHVVGAEGARMITARDLRSAEWPGQRSGGSIRWRARVVGHMAGSLFTRSMDRGERIYAAMQARGYDGEPRFLANPPLRTLEVVAAGALLTFAVALHLVERL